MMTAMISTSVTLAAFAATLGAGMYAWVMYRRGQRIHREVLAAVAQVWAPRWDRYRFHRPGTAVHGLACAPVIRCTDPDCSEPDVIRVTTSTEFRRVTAAIESHEKGHHS